jgi:hypothetical protein
MFACYTCVRMCTRGGVRLVCTHRRHWQRQPLAVDAAARRPRCPRSGSAAREASVLQSILALTDGRNGSTLDELRGVSRTGQSMHGRGGQALSLATCALHARCPLRIYGMGRISFIAQQCRYCMRQRRSQYDSPACCVIRCNINCTEGVSKRFALFNC